MTHSHDRTLLQRLGFNDADKRNSDHDLACRYVTQPEIAKLLQKKFLSATNRDWSGWRDDWSYHARKERSRQESRDWSLLSAQMEVPVSKGEHQYKTTIGFVDAVIRYRERIWTFTEYDCEGAVRTEREGSFFEHSLFIEVKTSPISIGDVLRQINLYREYTRYGSWLLASTCVLNDDLVASLRQAKIHACHLGERFQSWKHLKAEVAPVEAI